MHKSPRKGDLAQSGSAWRKLPALLVLILLALGAAGGRPAAAESEQSPLSRSLEAALRVPALSGARIGALVVRASDGATLWAHKPDAPLIPASNVKLLTSLAVLELLGPAHQFETRIRADRLPDPAGAIGDLVLQGGGDPALTSEDWWRIAADLRSSGLRKIQGDILVDDSAFDDGFWHPSWGAVSSRAYHAPVGALSANYGAFFVRVSPALQPGQPPSVTVDPPVDYLKVANRSKTTGPEGAHSLRVARGPSSATQEEIIVSGGFRLDEAPDLFARSVSDPALYAGSLLRLQLEGLGIDVVGRVRRGDSENGPVLLDFKGQPLSEIVKLTLKYSNNAMAETLVKVAGMEGAGRPGSWERGLPVLRKRLLDAGILGEEAVLADGSGLSTDNRLSARMLVRTLERARSSFHVGPEMLAALPISARDGTLEDRLDSGRDQIRAKTGLLSDSRVIALSGVIESDSGEERIFSILVNGYQGTTVAAMQAVDAWVASLSR